MTANLSTLHTPRLLLRPWTSTDGDRLFEILQEENILQYFPNTKPPRCEWVDKYIAHHQVHWRERGCGHWAVVARQDNRVVGWDGLEYLPELDETEVAYLLSKQVWGQGYASEAAQAAVRFGFEIAKLEKIIGLVHPENRASIRVLEKCGLTFADRFTLWGMEMCRYRITRSAPA